MMANEVTLFKSADPKKESKEVNKSPVTHISVSRGSYTHKHTQNEAHMNTHTLTEQKCLGMLSLGIR